jgi:hypothetical protein
MFFHRLSLKVRALNGSGLYPGLLKHVLASGIKNTGSEFGLLKARAFKIVQNCRLRIFIGIWTRLSGAVGKSTPCHY